MCIEDLGDIDILFTDKTGTLTEGQIRFVRSLGVEGTAADEPLRLGLLCTEALVDSGRAAGGNALDVAQWDSPAAAGQLAAVRRYRRIATLPFDHERRMVAVLVDSEGADPLLITKGAPEEVLARCIDVPAAARIALDAEFAAGNRVVAVASRPSPGWRTLERGDESGLSLRGLLVFLDPPKPSARGALDRLATLGSP